MKTFRQFLYEANDKEGNPLEDYHGKPIPTNKDGTLTLYHHTTPENADKIKQSGKWMSKESTQEIWFSNRKGEHADGYGTGGVVKVKVHPRIVRQTDSFPSGEHYFAIHKNHLTKKHIQK